MGRSPPISTTLAGLIPCALAVILYLPTGNFARNSGPSETVFKRVLPFMFLDLQIDIRQILATIGGKGKHKVVVVCGPFQRLGLLFADTAHYVIDAVLCLDFQHIEMGGQNNAHGP